MHQLDTCYAGGRDSIKALEEQFECTICRDWMVACHSMVPCGHMFCGSCLGDWLPKNPTCPTCRYAPPADILCRFGGTTCLRDRP